MPIVATTPDRSEPANSAVPAYNRRHMSLTPGTRLGPYEIIEPAGAGGMGEVYRAHDVRLDRDVAVKTIKGPFTERFEREARAISSLNHPHICTLHDVGEHDGSGYLVMEYIEGKPDRRAAAGRAGLRLRHPDLRGAPRRAQEGHRPSRPQARQHPAHQAGREAARLRPRQADRSGNSGVMSAPSASMGEQATVAALTGAHTVVGTPQYMAPEQIEAREVDARTDIFAFGCVLYELLTGPARVRRQDLVERDGRGAGHQAAPDRGARAADAAGARADRVALPGQGSRGSLADGARRRGGAAVGRRRADRRSGCRRSSRVRRRTREGIGVGRVRGGGARGCRVWCRLGAAGARSLPPVVRFPLLSPPGTQNPSPPVVSPDGRHIAFAADGDGKRLIWVRAARCARAARRCPAPRACCGRSGHPTAASSAFMAGGKLKKVDIAGGPPTDDLRGAQRRRRQLELRGRDPVRRPLRRSVVARPGGRRQSAAGRVRQGQGDGTPGAGWPEFLPDGKHFLFTLGDVDRDDADGGIARLEG